MRGTLCSIGAPSAMPPSAAGGGAEGTSLPGPNQTLSQGLPRGRQKTSRRRLGEGDYFRYSTLAVVILRLALFFLPFPFPYYFVAAAILVVMVRGVAAVLQHGAW